MRAALKTVLSWLALLGLTLAGRAEDCPLVVPVSDAGWYNAANFHDPENNNYIAGHHAAGPAELRNFFVFDLPVLKGLVGGAQLRIFSFTISTPQNAETYELRHVATPVETLVAGAGPELATVFDDLGEGALFATRPVTNSEANAYLTLTLNSNALAALNAASGQRFALGGRVTTLAAAPGVDEKLFAYSSGTAPYVELTLTFAGTNAPFLFQEPPPLVVTNSGSPVSFSVSACGADPLRYRWFFNDAPLNQTNRTLTLGSPHSGSSGEYFAVVSNAFGVVTSAPSLLIVDGFPPAIYYLAETQTVVVGDTAWFQPFVAGTPAPALQWYFAGLEIPDATNFYYQIPNVQPFHAAVVSLVASNLLGVVTNQTVLQVEPLLLSGLYDLAVAAGDVAYPTIDVSSSVPASYQWRLGGTNLPGANARVLTVPNVPPDGSGPYDVIVANAYGARTSSVATVTASSGPPAAAPPYFAYNPLLEQDVMILSQAQGSLPLSFQWFFNGQPIADATNSNLLLVKCSTNQNGAYSYTASNAFGVVGSVAVFLNAAVLRAEVFPYSTSRDVFVDHPVALQAIVYGAPPPQLQWRRDGTNLPGATNFSLLFSNVTAADAGFYVLHASNALAGGSGGFSVSVQPRRALDRWTWRNSKPQANDLRAVASGPGRIVAGGEGGSLATSTNGIDWITTALGQQFRIERVVFGNGRFAALAFSENDLDLLFLSTDGVQWEPHTLPVLDAFTFDFANGEFFLTGYDGGGPPRVGRSADAVNWTMQSVPAFSGSYLAGLAFGNGRYVLAGPEAILVSHDAVSWERYVAPVIPTRLTFGNGVFAASTSDGLVWTSVNGREWFARNTGLFASSAATANLQSIATGQGQFVAVGLNGALVRSANGQSWTAADATTARDLRDVVFTGTQWVVAGNDGVLLTSPDGVTWTDRRNGRTRDLYGIIYTNQQFVAVGYEGTVLTSPDALTWTARSSGTTRDLHAITYAAGLYVAGGRNGTILTSPNAVNWVSRPTPTTNYIERIAWGGGRFVAAATHGTILSSTNGTDWQQHAHPAPADTEFEGVAYGGGRFVMVGSFFTGNAHSIMLVSSNGTDWLDVSEDVGKGLRGVNHDGNQFLAVGNDGVVIYSANGQAWGSQQSIAPFRNWRHVRTALGHSIVVGNGGAMASLDEIGWHPRTGIVSQNLHDIAYGAGKFVAVGNAGTIVQSDFAVPFISGSRYTNGLMHFHVTGGLEEAYRLEYSLFLNAWQTVGTYTNDGGSVVFTNAGNPFQGFYRAVSP